MVTQYDCTITLPYLHISNWLVRRQSNLRAQRQGIQLALVKPSLLCRTHISNVSKLAQIPTTTTPFRPPLTPRTSIFRGIQYLGFRVSGVVILTLKEALEKPHEFVHGVKNGIHPVSDLLSTCCVITANFVEYFLITPSDNPFLRRRRLLCIFHIQPIHGANPEAV
jgi:hypothetical protein